MLSAKPWKTDAVMRLGVSIILCMYAGWLVMTAAEYHPTGPRLAHRFYAALLGASCCTLGSLILVRMRWRLESFLWRALALWACFSGTIALGGVVAKVAGPMGPSLAQMVIAALSIQGAALVWAVAFVHEHGVTWTEAFGLNRRPGRAVLAGLIVICIFLPVGYFVQLGSVRVIEFVAGRWPRLGLKVEPQEAVQTAQLAVTLTQRVILAVITLGVAPVAEEVVFRGIMYPWLKRAGFPRVALWGTVLLFAFAHFYLAGFVPLALLALVLTVLYEYSDNLLAPIAAHALFNGYTLFRLYLLQ